MSQIKLNKSGMKTTFVLYSCGISRRQRKDATAQCFEEVQKKPADVF